jgi:LCP family protein required for cell wall assembly
MDRSKRKRINSVDGFVPSRVNSPLSNPFDKISKAKLGSTRSLIPHRKAAGFSDFKAMPRAEKTTPLQASRLQPSSNSALVTSGSAPITDMVMGGNYEEPKISRRAKRKNEQLAHVQKKKRLRKFIKYFIILVVLFCLSIGGFLGFKVFHNIDKVFGGNIISNFTSLFGSNVQLKGQSSGRVNILIAGDSADQLNHGGAQLTDSIVLVSINTQNDTAFMISIPRDLWINIPGMGWEKINAANDNFGTHLAGFPNNGMGLLEQLVVNQLGIPVDYYALSDYGAFRDAVNAVGGVTVNIQSNDPRGLYDPNTNIKLPNGIVTLNGQQALNLARARGDGYGSYGFPSSDFDRTMHQRQLFTAIAAKAKTIGVLDNPIKIGNLFDALGNNVQTDLSLKDILSLVSISKKINLNNIKSYSFCSTLTLGLNGCNKAILTDYTDPASGQEAIVPVLGLGNFTGLTQYYNQLTSSNALTREAASIIILNGSNTTGLATTFQNKIVAAGGNVTSIGDTSTTSASTQIIDNSGGNDPGTKAYLESLFGKNVVASTATNNPPGATFVVVLGTAQKAPATN